MPLLMSVLPGCGAAPDCDADSGEHHSDAGCLIISDGRVLVLRHRFHDKLGIPGGRAHSGEPARCTARRETREGTGLDVRVGAELGQLGDGFTLYRCRAEARTDQEPEPPGQAGFEVRAMLWLRPKAIDRAQWRYPEQLDLFRRLADKASETEKNQ